MWSMASLKVPGYTLFVMVGSLICYKFNYILFKTYLLNIFIGIFEEIVVKLFWKLFKFRDLAKIWFYKFI